ncbi:MAG: sugar phosphate isomerase/epimerase [Opitutae bacterium]|nr:sugar phosphate isomerase/epimerase [Opitutae bacterium]
MNRRSFIQSALATAAATGATWFDTPQLLAASGARSKSFKKYGGFPMGIQSYSLRGFGAEEAFKKINELGLHWVEPYGTHYPPTTNAVAIKKMKAKLDALDITVSAHGVHGFSKNHERNEQLFKFAKHAGIRNLSANPSADSFDSLEKLVDQYDVRIAIHNHGPGALYDKLEDGLKAVKGRDPRIGFCADLGHYIRSGIKPEDAIEGLTGRLYGIHLKDFAEMKKKTHGVILGEGHMDVKAVFKALLNAKFPADGALSLEYEENPKNPIADIQKCLKVAAAGAQAALEA